VCIDPTTKKGQLYGRLELRQQGSTVIHSMMPHCSTSTGSLQAIEVALSARNDGWLGLAEENCLGHMEQVHAVNDSRLVYWHVMYPGSFTICHIPYDRPEKRVQQAKFHVLDATAYRCGLLFTNGTRNVRCEFPTQRVERFDGFELVKGPRPPECLPDCQACLAQQGLCYCAGSLDGELCRKCMDCESKECECVEDKAGIVR